MFTFWSKLRETPFYKREKGLWGNPNEFYTYANRFAPLLIIGSLFLGMCGGVTNFAGTSDAVSQTIVLFYCFYCLPTIGVQMLTWTGVVMIPTLTAPIISEELKRGSWDMLMVTPYPIQTILWAKALGGLSRLYIWWPLLILSVIQLLGTVLAAVVILANLSTGSVVAWNDTFSTMVVVTLAGLGLSLRPWVELVFVALVGLCCSTATKSGGLALAITYAIIIVVKMVCGNTLWTVLTAAILTGSPQEEWIPIAGSYIPLLMYAFLITITFFLLRRQMEQLATEGLPES